MTLNQSAGGAPTSAGLRPRPELTDWTVTIVMVHAPDGPSGIVERRAFTTIVPATSEAYAFIGASQYGNAINEGSSKAWKFDGEQCITVEPAGSQPPASDLTFHAVGAVNRQRCERWHPGFPNDGWTGSDWSNAMAGEAGETCNVVKKLRRIEFGLNQAAGDTRPELLTKLATEIGDTFMYLDLLAQHYGLNLARCVVDTFNRVSVRESFPERLPAESEGSP